MQKIWKIAKPILLVIGALWMFILIFTQTLGYDRAVVIVADLFNVPVEDLIADPTDFSNPTLDQIQTNSYILFFLASFISAIFGVFILSQGRTLFEIVWLFVAFAIPPKKKYWGLIYDKKDYHPLPFATVRLFNRQGEDKKFLSQTVSDLDGRYRLNVANASADYVLETQAEAYQPSLNEVKSGSPELLNRQITLDIAMQKLNLPVDAKTLTELIYRLKSRLYLPTIVFLYIWAIFGITFNLYGMLAWTSPTSMISFTFYFSAFIWNTYTIRDRFQFGAPSVREIGTKLPIEGVIIKLFKNDVAVANGITTADGRVKLDMPEGEYLVEAAKTGYIQVDNNDKEVKLLPVNVRKDGHLGKTLYLRKVGKDEDTNSTLVNPFG